MYGIKVKPDHFQPVLDYCDAVKIDYVIWDIEKCEIEFSRESDRDNIHSMLERGVL